MDGQEWRLCLGDVLEAAAVPLAEALVVRHTFRPDGLPAGSTSSQVLAYTRSQTLGGKFPTVPPRWWLVFTAETGFRSRLYTVYDNTGENTSERTSDHRFYDLQPSSLLHSLHGRLVIEWSRDPVNWAKPATTAARFPVVEIADPHIEAFPGYDHLILPYTRLQQVITEPRYLAWRAALQAVQGIYLITDTTTGSLYVGKADGADGVLGRWEAYARTGHGGNVTMRELAHLDTTQPQRYQFSLLQVFGPDVPRARIDAAEAHYKHALGTRHFGLNRN